MLNISRDVDSLSNFKRDTSRFVKRMKKSGSPVVLTINGKAELVVQDAESYQRLVRFAEEIESLEFLRKSLEDVDAGRTISARDATKSLGRKK